MNEIRHSQRILHDLRLLTFLQTLRHDNCIVLLMDETVIYLLRRHVYFTHQVSDFTLNIPHLTDPFLAPALPIRPIL